MSVEERINVDLPLWDQNTFYGRFRHFAWMTNPVNGLVTSSTLEEAKVLVTQYREGREPLGTTGDQVRGAMKLYHSAFHPDTGELQNVFGRMSFQTPGGMIITGAMLQFYKSVPQVVFWQWFNQSFNALVNYTNRSASSPSSNTQLLTAYTSATFCALGTAIGLKKVLEKSSSRLLQRFVPFAAVASANCVNIPLMRQQELLQGISLTTEQGDTVCSSKKCAVSGISQVVFSRVLMAAPGMLCLPLIMTRLERLEWFRASPLLHMPAQVLGVGCFLSLMVPTACPLFPQTVTVSTDTLRDRDPDAYQQLKEKFKDQVPQTLFFNKGL